MSRLTAPSAVVTERPLPAGDQEGLVGPGHLDPGQHEEHEQDHQHGDAADGDEQGHGVVPPRSSGGSGAVETTWTEVSVGVSTTYTGVPVGSGTSLRAWYLSC